MLDNEIKVSELLNLHLQRNLRTGKRHTGYRQRRYPPCQPSRLPAIRTNA